MATIRVLPPDASAISTIVNGRTYSTTGGTPLDVPDFDALVLKANGWHISDGSGVGTTTTRPTMGLTKGMRFTDTTLGYSITWDGKAWRNPVTGATV